MATETWVLNETLTISGSNIYNNIEMTYSGQQRAYPIKSLKIYEYIDGRKTAYSVLGQEQSVYSDENTSYELYGTGGGASGWFSYNGTLYNTWKFSKPVTDTTLLAWLQANGTKQAETPKVTVDLTSLSGYESLPAGTYALAVKSKAANYQDSDLSSTVSFTKLAAPVVTASDTTVTWDGITNAESYDVYVDGELYENTTGGGVTANVWYVLKSSGIPVPDNEIDVTIDFHTLGKLTTFKRIRIYAENNKTKIKYYYSSSGAGGITWGDGVSGLSGTIQFLQPIPSELSEWLAANATQQVLPILKAGTYVLKEKPEVANPAINAVMTFDTYYLTANNTYATGLWTCYGMSSGRKFNDTSELARAYYSSADDGATQFSVTECGETTGWIHHDWNDGEVWYSYTATDTAKLRTIIISTDYTVPTAFYTWFSTNTTKQS